MLTIKAMTGGETYASHHLTNNDYYAVGETVTGQWIGRGAALLGLEGDVDLADFDRIRMGLDPKTGEFLRERHSADRYDKDGKKVGAARSLYDFTVSAPKDLSIQALEDPRLIEVHRMAASEMIAELENLAGSRIRKGGLNETRATSNMVISAWNHDTSRELDPQLHTHFVAANLTFDGTEQKWKALQPYEAVAQREYLTEVYRNAAARELLKLGYQIEDRLAWGEDNGFGIAGIDQATREKFSRRSAQRDAAIRKFVEKNGRLPNNNEVALMVRESRAEKLTEITTPEVRELQRARMTPEEAQTLAGLREQALERGSIQHTQSPEQAMNQAAEHLFERVSVAKEHELKAEALRFERGQVDLREVKAELAGRVASGAMLGARGEVATHETLQREREMIRLVDDGMGRFEALGKGKPIEAPTLRPEQLEAVRTILASRDFAVNLQGAAGTGKTKTLEELRRGLIGAGREVIAVAPTASAVEELAKVGFEKPMTIARLLSAPSEQARLKGGEALIVDEAGMVSAKDMSDLLQLAQEKRLRVVFSGDTKQIHAVEAGDALRILERESQLKAVSLLDVQRQQSAAYKAAVETLRRNPRDGFEQLTAMDAVREVSWLTRHEAANEEYQRARRMQNAKGQERSVLVVAATHDEIQSVTFAIRQELKRGGELGDGQTVTRHAPLHWTEARKKRIANYKPGMILEHDTPSRHPALEVVAADEQTLTARTSGNKTVKLSAADLRQYSVFQKQEIDVAAGDKLLLQVNWRAKRSGFKATNGELVTVAAVKDGRIELTDGRELPQSYKQFAHGYAVTAHRSQGKTVDEQIILADRMKQDLFYVAVTRGREALKVITSDAAGLQESIGINADRQSASELHRTQSEVAARIKKEFDFRSAYSTHPQFEQGSYRHVVQQTPQSGTGLGF